MKMVPQAYMLTFEPLKPKKKVETAEWKVFAEFGTENGNKRMFMGWVDKVGFHICPSFYNPPVLSPVALYEIARHIELLRSR